MQEPRGVEAPPTDANQSIEGLEWPSEVDFDIKQFQRAFNTELPVVPEFCHEDPSYDVWSLVAPNMVIQHDYPEKMCHLASVDMAEKYGFTLMTGYTLVTGGFWGRHSWCVDNEGVIHEPWMSTTTVYAGFETTPKWLVMFATDKIDSTIGHVGERTYTNILFTKKEVPESAITSEYTYSERFYRKEILPMIRAERAKEALGKNWMNSRGKELIILFNEE